MFAAMGVFSRKHSAGQSQTVNVLEARLDTILPSGGISVSSGSTLMVTYKANTPGAQSNVPYVDFGQTDTPNLSPPLQYFIRIGYLQVNGSTVVYGG